MSVGVIGDKLADNDRVNSNSVMETSFTKIMKGYQGFRKKYTLGDQAIMYHLAEHGQRPQVMVVACCDSRVDPALILQCDPGDLFVVRNMANIIPPYENDGAHHGTSAALEFGVRCLRVEHLILLGHSHCGGIRMILNNSQSSDFIKNWGMPMTICDNPVMPDNLDHYAKLGLNQSYHNCVGFPWIKERLEQKDLLVHRWFFDIKKGEILTYCEENKEYLPL